MISVGIRADFMQLLKNRYAYVLSLVLILQAAFYYSMAYRAEHIPVVKPLSVFPASLNGWGMVSEVPIEQEIKDLLRADDTLNRVYAKSDQGPAVNLFIAFFRTQRYNQNPHSPKNCLPGNGYEPLLDRRISIHVPVWNRMITANEYVVQHGEQKSVVLYWYQSHNRVIASEYAARIWLVADAIRYHRSDTSIVRVVIPVSENDIDGAAHVGTQFIQAMWPYLLKQLPA
jgi:EpsI family protein